jgi:hypothetical protein
MNVPVYVTLFISASGGTGRDDAARVVEHLGQQRLPLRPVVDSSHDRNCELSYLAAVIL